MLDPNANQLGLTGRSSEATHLGENAEHKLALRDDARVRFAPTYGALSSLENATQQNILGISTEFQKQFSDFRNDCVETPISPCQRANFNVRLTFPAPQSAAHSPLVSLVYVNREI